MSSLAARKTAGLEQKLAALDAEFREWLSITEEKREFEKHHTQLRALVGHLCGLRSGTIGLFERAKQSGILAEARNLESLLLGIRRIWEFFRSKLVQRRDPAMRLFLQLADELAWVCYKPMLDVAGAMAHREPPLVFLNGGLSPFALSREDAFFAEDVPGEALAGRTWDPVLRHLPIPVIGVPWYQTAHLPDLLVVAHETGHTVEEDFGLHDSVLCKIEAQLKGTSGAARSAHWQAWSKEIFADLWGCLTLGPAFAGSLMDFLAVGRNLIENEVATDQGKYPTAHLRIQLCLEALRRKELDFDAEQAAVRRPWAEEFRASAMSDFDADVAAIVEAILGSEHEIGGKAWSLSKIPDLRFTPADWSFAKEAVKEKLRGKTPESANTAPRLVAAARFLFEQDPAEYVRGNYGDAFSRHIEVIVRPGTRAGEAPASEDEKERLSATSRALGEAWFRDFAIWAGAHLRP